MSDDELKRLLQGLFSDLPADAATDAASGQAQPDAGATEITEIPSRGLAPARAHRGQKPASGMPKHRETPPVAEVDRPHGLIRRLWASSQAISTAGDQEQIGQALLEFAAQAGVHVARLLIFVDEVDGAPATLEMRDGWTADNRPAQPFGTRLPLSSYPLLEFMRADQPVVVEDVTTDLRANDTVRTFMAVARVGSFLIVPLCAAQNWLGAFLLGRNTPSAFAGDLVDITWTLAGQAAVALQHLKRLDELQATLRTLAQRNAEQDALIDNIPDGIYFKDAESRFTRINTYQAGVLGVPGPEAAVGKTDRDFYAPEFAEQAWADERRIIESRQPLIGRIEKTIRRSDGQERWVSATKIPLADDQGNLTGLVGISRDITDIKIAQEMTQRRATELQLAAEISKAATGLLDPDQLMQQAVTLIADRFGLYYAGLFLVDHTGEWAVLRAGTSEAGRSMVGAGHRLAIGGRSMIGQCVASATARIALDVGAEPAHFDNPLLPDTRSELALPLISHGRAIGGLTIQSTAEAAFDEEDIAALQTMADQLANAIDNARLFQERERRIEELATVTEVGQAVASTLDPQTLFEIVHRQVSRLFDANSFYIATYQEGSDEWESAFHVERGERQPEARYSVQSGITGYIIRTRQPLLFGTRQENLDFAEAHGFEVIGAPAVSWLAVPLIAADRCVGVICVQNYDRENLYGDHDLAVFTTIAGQVAAALDNARLFQEMQQRTVEFQALYDVALSLGTQMERQELLRLIVEQAVALLDAQAGGFYLYDPGAGELVFSVATGYFTDFVGARLKPGEGLAGQVFINRRSEVVSDYQTWPSRAGVYDQEIRLHNLLAVPLTGRAGVLGVLDIAGGKQKAAFSPQDTRLAELFAAQAAAALENLQLLEDSRRRAAELEALNEVGRATTAVLDLDGLLGQIVDITKERFGHYFVGIALTEGPPGTGPAEASGTGGTSDRLIFRSGSTIGDTGARMQHGVGVDLTAGASLIAEAARTRQLVVVNDVLSDPRYMAVDELPGTRSELDLPIEVKGRVVGVLTVQSDRVGTYDQTAAAILQSLASQAGAAIDNARLFDQARASARELAVLNDMGRALSGMLTVDAVVDSIHQYVSQLMDATNFYVALYDPDKDEISFPLYIDGDQVRRTVAGRRSGKGMTEHVIRTRQPLLVKDNLDALLVEMGVESIGQASHSWLGVPMLIGEQPIGVITVQSYTTPRVYEEHARDLLTAVAGQAAIAIQNARLFEQTQAALAETEARARRERIGREITASVRASIDADAVMQTAVRELGIALGRPAFIRIGSAEQLRPNGDPPGESPATLVAADTVPAKQAGKVATGRSRGAGRRGQKPGPGQAGREGGR